jgi:hypothetical protein
MSDSSSGHGSEALGAEGEDNILESIQSPSPSWEPTLHCIKNPPGRLDDSIPPSQGNCSKSPKRVGLEGGHPQLRRKKAFGLSYPSSSSHPAGNSNDQANHGDQGSRGSVARTPSIAKDDSHISSYRPDDNRENIPSSFGR